jgi:cytochrome b6-f complex iron-sulfur subunit
MVIGLGRGSVEMNAGGAVGDLPEPVGFVPDMERRNIMNLVLLFGGVVPAVGGLAVPYILFFVPRSSGGGGSGLIAKTKAGDDITLKGWMAEHKTGDR